MVARSFGGLQDFLHQSHTASIAAAVHEVSFGVESKDHGAIILELFGDGYRLVHDWEDRLLFIRVDELQERSVTFAPGRSRGLDRLVEEINRSGIVEVILLARPIEEDRCPFERLYLVEVGFEYSEMGYRFSGDFVGDCCSTSLRSELDDRTHVTSFICVV
jgi:hypothetical protein